MPVFRRGAGARTRTRRGPPRNKKNNNRSYASPRGGGRRGGRIPTRFRHSDRTSNVVPPPSLTAGSVGKAERELITTRQLFGAADIEKLSKVHQVWANALVPQKNCVTRLLFNKSDIAVDMTNPLLPVAVASKKTITHLTSIIAQGQSSIVQMILAAGHKRFNESSAMQQNLSTLSVESRPKVDIIRTPKLRVPTRATMVGKKGHKIYEMTLEQFPGLKFDYALAADVLTVTGEHSQTSDFLGLVDFTVGIHSLPNASHVPSTEVVEPPDLILERDNDPRAVMKGYSPATSETALRIAANKKLYLKPTLQGRFVFYTDLANLVPKPVPGTLFTFKDPVKIVRSLNEVTPISLAYAEPSGSRLSLFENVESFIRGYNEGAVTESTITILSGNFLSPRRIPHSRRTHYYLNGNNEEFVPGDRVLQIVRKQVETPDQQESQKQQQLQASDSASVCFETEEVDSDESITTLLIDSLTIKPKDRANKLIRDRMRVKN